MKKKKQRDNINDAPAPDKIDAQQAPESGDAVKPVEESCRPLDSVPLLRERVESLEESLLRARADYQNLQRTSARERTDALRYANAELMKSLLTVIDDFERTLAAAAASAERSSVVEGVRLVHENLMKALSHYGLEAIEAAGRSFDPSVHQALLQQSSGDQAPGTVLEEVAKGYRLCDRVIRPSKVVVSKAPEQNPSGAVEATTETQPREASRPKHGADGQDPIETQQASCDARE